MTERRVRVWVQRFPDRPHLVLQWHDPETGKRRSKTAGTADAKRAEHLRADLDADLNAGRHKGASRMAWARFRELFEEEYVAHRRPNTQANFKATFDSFEKMCAPRRLDLVDVRAVSRFEAGMRSARLRGGKRGMDPGTVKVRLSFLRMALRWAHAQELIPRVPRFPAVKVPQRRPQPVPAESFERLLEQAADQQLRAFLLTGWLCGLRIAEAFHLERQPTEDAPYLAPERRQIILPARFVKGARDQWVPLPPELAELLGALPHHGRRVFRFVNRQGGLLTADGVAHRIQNAARRAGVRLTMRSLRRGFACRYAGKVPAPVLQQLMRHASITTTAVFYANVEADAMEAVLGPGRNKVRNIAPAPAAAEDGESALNPGG
jgi:integrase